MFIKKCGKTLISFLYRSPSVIKTPERLLHPHQQVHHHLNQPQSPRSAASGMLRGNLTRGLSLGELNPRSQMSPLDFDTAKIATQGTLKRLKLVKSPTDTQLFVPNHVLLQHQQQQQPQPNIELPSGKWKIFKFKFENGNKENRYFMRGCVSA